MASGDRTFYHYVDADGNDVVVDDISAVPSDAQGQAARVKVDEPPPPSTKHLPREPVHAQRPGLEARAHADRGTQAVSSGGGPAWLAPSSTAFHAPSFALGAALMLVVMALVAWLKGSGMRLVLQVVLVGVVVATLSSAYVSMLASLVQGAGLPPVHTPGQIVDQAQDVRDQANQQNRALDEALKDTER